MNFKKIKSRWAKWRSERLIRSYCLSMSAGSRGARSFNLFLLFLLSVLAAFWLAADLWQAGTNVLLVIMLWIPAAYLLRRRDDRELLKSCRAKIAADEYARRIDAAEPEDVLAALEKRICAAFPVRFFERKDYLLLGVYKEEKLAVIYRRRLNNDLVETRDMMQALYDARAQGAVKVRVFTNTEFALKAENLGERFGLEVKLYNGERMQKMLRESPYYPTEAELDTALKRESEKRLRRMTIFKKEALKKNKTRNYILYGLVLLVMGRFGLGNLYLNSSFALIMLVLAVLSFLNKENGSEEVVF